MTREELLSACAEAQRWSGYLRLATEAWDATGGFAPPRDDEDNTRTSLPEGVTSYIERHPLEDRGKWRWRVRRATYFPLARVIGDTLIGFLFSVPPSRDGDQALLDWTADVDGRGTDLDHWLQSVAVHMLLYPFALVHVGAPAEQAPTLADARAAGMRPWLDLVHPASVRAYRLDERGALVGLRLVDTVTEGGVSTAATQWQRVVVYEADGDSYTVSVWKLKDSLSAPELIGQDTIAGSIPFVIARVSESLAGGLYGSAPLRGVIDETVGLYNDMSLLDEAIAAQCFSVLAIQHARGDAPKDIVLGAGNAIGYAEGLAAPSFITPSTAPLEALQEQIAQRIRRAFRSARMEFALGDTAPQSGISRQYEFAACNRFLARIASALADCERRMMARVAEHLGVSADDYVVSWQTNFDVRDVDASVKRALDAVLLPFGPTVKAKLLTDLADTLVDLSDDERRRAVLEIEQEVGVSAEAAPAPAPAEVTGGQEEAAGPSGEPSPA